MTDLGFSNDTVGAIAFTLIGLLWIAGALRFRRREVIHGIPPTFPPVVLGIMGVLALLGALAQIVW